MDTTLLICTLSLDSLPEDTIAVRCIVYSNIETMIEYYKTIVGVKEINIEAISVPSSFDIKYIGPVGDPYLTYPAYDIAVLKKDLESYKNIGNVLKRRAHDRLKDLETPGTGLRS